MNNELIKITEKDGQQLVSAKELHEFLGLSKHLTQWIKPYINENNDYGFIENVDFTRIDGEVNPTNGIPTIDYAITIDMAKELSMLSKTEKGREARKYFIQCEKKLKQQPQLPQDYLSALKALVASEEEKQKLTLENTIQKDHINKLKPKAHYTDIVLASSSLGTTTVIAKDYGMSAIKMNKLLHDLGVQYKQGKHWLLYAEYQADGYTSSKTVCYNSGNGITGVDMQMQWTQKGRKFIYDLLKENGILPLIERNNLQIA